ncbi:hypothetical protein PO124_03615 [Bacillus licheniformis]|nr:hypothetical protein [Bacillus licheniformis]
MAETKRGIVLFHEALKSVAVPHQIVGFGKIQTMRQRRASPTTFIRSFLCGFLKAGAGPHIMQLEPEEDNRDGYAIRQMTKMLVQRSEAQKFLIVFQMESRPHSIMSKRDRRYT